MFWFWVVGISCGVGLVIVAAAILLAARALMVDRDLCISCGLFQCSDCPDYRAYRDANVEGARCCCGRVVWDPFDDELDDEERLS